MNDPAKRVMGLGFIIAAAMLLQGCESAPQQIDPLETAEIAQSDTAASVAVTEPKPSETITLTLALTGQARMQDVIDAFNAADNGYQIEVRSYAKSSEGVPTEEEYHYADLAFLQDIMTTDEVDIVCSASVFDAAYYEILQKKGAFADLYPFMEQDAEVNTSTLNDHILQLNETDGKLYRLPTFYGAETLIGEAKYVGSKENWTVDEFNSQWKKRPGEFTIGGATQSEDIYYNVLRGNLNSFIDYENAQVHFDVPEFRRILEFCNQFDSNHGNKGVYDYDLPSFVSQARIDTFMYMTGVYSGDIDYTLVGYPSDNGEGAFFYDRDNSWSISAKSSPEKQRGAWEFIRTFATYEYQKSHVIEFVEFKSDPSKSFYTSERGFCVNNRAFDETVHEIMDGKYYHGTIESKGETIEITLPTQEDLDGTLRYFNTINQWQAGCTYALNTIINEEVMKYFAGDASLDETANSIQSRASLWISEQS